MTREEIEKLSDKEFWDWLMRLAKDHKYKEIKKLCEIRLHK